MMSHRLLVKQSQFKEKRLNHDYIDTKQIRNDAV